MAQSYEEYIKSLTPAGSTPVPSTYKSFLDYKQPSTSNSGSTQSTPVQTPQQIIQQATSGIIPQSTKVPNKTEIPTAQNIIQNTPAYGSTPNTSAPYVYQENQYRTTNDPFPGYSVSPYTPGVSAPTQQSKTLSSGESANLAKDYGLSGIVNPSSYTGLTMSQARAKAEQDKTLRQNQVSSNTSFTYNPESISKFNDTGKNLMLKLDTIKNDVFTSSQQKKSDTDALVKSFTNQFSQAFNTPEEFQAALSNSPEIQKTVQEFQRNGGQLSDIATAITQKTQQTQNTQTLDQYLGRVSTPAEKQAYESMLPENRLAQDQLSFEQQIPEKYKDLYFGTPERMGILEQQKIQAQERAALLETQAQLEKENAKAQADLLIQKNNAELAVEEATIEENRLHAKNYTTRMLAKLGALNTTGAAVDKMTSLEQRYQRQAQQLRTTYSLQNKAYEVKLNESLNNIDVQKQDKILSLREDLTKSQEEVAKELFKLEIASQRESFKIIDKFVGEFSKQKEKYIKEAKEQAEKNAKAQSALASSYNLSGFSLSDFLSKGYQAGVPTPMLGAKVDNPLSKTGSATLPAYLNALQGKKISNDLKAVLAGESKLSDYTPTDATKIQRELTQLGIKKADLPGGDETKKPEVGTLLREAKIAVESGKDKKAVRQRFLEAYPEKSAAYDEYFQ